MDTKDKMGHQSAFHPRKTQCYPTSLQIGQLAISSRQIMLAHSPTLKRDLIIIAHVNNLQCRTLKLYGIVGQIKHINQVSSSILSTL